MIKKKIKYYSIEKLLEENAMYNVIYGGRSNGKSYAVKKYMLEQSFEQQRYFGLIFRRESDKKVKELENYFADAPIREITGNKYIAVKIKAGEVHFVTNEGKKGPKIGYAFFLDRGESYKSGTYEGVHNLFFEELISEGGKYLFDEPTKLDSLISTVFRLREDCHVFMIGNTISEVHPYKDAWGLKNFGDSQKKGTIDMYYKDFLDECTGLENRIKIACERCNAIENPNMALSKKGAQALKGDFETDDFILYSKADLAKFEGPLYQFVVTYSGFYFLLSLYRDKQTYFLHCEKKTTEIQPKTRVIGNIQSLDPLYTSDFTPLFNKENFIFTLIDQKKVTFSTNLTGTNFYTVLKQIR